MVKKKNLLKLLDFVSAIAMDKENAWFREQLVSKFSHSEIAQRDKLDEIYELCIQEIAEKQADMFYADFRIRQIKKELAQYFLNAERFRRNDDFIRFCLEVNKQFECIINFFANDPDFINFKTINMNTRVYPDSNNTQTFREFIFSYKNGNSVDDRERNENLYMKPLTEWGYRDRFKIIGLRYFMVADKKTNNLKLNFSLYKELFDAFDDIYRGRNLNHSGIIYKESDKQKIENLLQNKYINFYRFAGALEKFISILNPQL